MSLVVTVVADSGSECSIAIVQPFRVETRLDFSSILVLGGPAIARCVDLHRYQIPQPDFWQIGRSDETSNPITRDSRSVTVLIAAMTPAVRTFGRLVGLGRGNS
jgi:hypothetical protein